ERAARAASPCAARPTGAWACSWSEPRSLPPALALTRWPCGACAAAAALAAGPQGGGVYVPRNVAGDRVSRECGERASDGRACAGRGEAGEPRALALRVWLLCCAAKLRDGARQRSATGAVREHTAQRPADG